MTEKQQLDPDLIELMNIGLINERKVILYDLHDNEVVSYKYEVKRDFVSKVFKKLKYVADIISDKSSKGVFESYLLNYDLLPNIERENFFKTELNKHIDNIEAQFITNDEELISDIIANGKISYKEYLQFYKNDVTCIESLLQSKFFSDWFNSIMDKKVAELLKTEIDLIQSNTETVKSLELENPHPRIFPNGKCWQLFEFWKENAKDIKVDLCFAYWQMIEDKLMYKITPTQFTEWLNELNIDFDGYWKQLHRVNKPERKLLYSMAKLQFQLNKSQY